MTLTSFEELKTRITITLEKTEKHNNNMKDLIDKLSKDDTDQALI